MKPQNNTYYSYVNIDVVDNVLIIQHDSEGEQLRQLFSDDFNVTVKKISEAPATLNELREYDQVILANIANADMPEGFINILNSYVYDAGGSLLTVGGTREENGETIANVYNREDMEGTLYQDMLPVLAEDYTPPVAVLLVIDVSGSMEGTGSSGMKLIKEAQESAKASLAAGTSPRQSAKADLAAGTSPRRSAKAPSGDPPAGAHGAAGGAGPPGHTGPPTKTRYYLCA